MSVAYDDADLSVAQAIHDMVERTARAMGAVDILVNNAGIQHVEPIDTFPAEKWDAILALNLTAVFHATQAALPEMKRRGWGRIVNIASAHGLVASPFKGAYVAAKHGVVGFTKVTALEAAEAGVTCNAVCPGYVWTPLVERQVAAQAAAHGIPEEQVIRTIMLAEQPTKRFVSVEEVAGTVAFLCSPEAASITGAAITVDGGYLQIRDHDTDELTEASNAAANLVRAGKLDEAERAAHDLLARFPDVHDGYDRLGMVCEARGDHRQAAEYYRKAIAVIRAHPDDYDPEFEAVFQKLIDRLDPPGADTPA